MNIADDEWVALKNLMERVLGNEAKRIDLETPQGLKISVYKMSDRQIRTDITGPPEVPNAN